METEMQSKINSLEGQIEVYNSYIFIYKKKDYS